MKFLACWLLGHRPRQRFVSPDVVLLYCDTCQEFR